jgi:hypothetical protein
MRTTVSIDDDVFEAAQAQAKASGERLGKVLSEMARHGLRSGRIRSKGTNRPLFKVPGNAKIIPGDRARDLLADDLP